MSTTSSTPPTESEVLVIGAGPGGIATQCPYPQVTYDAMTRADDLDAYDVLVRIG